jgi:AcrR family transcriptional regulator
LARIDITDIRRRQIIDAAFKVFSEKGYHSSTMADIAAELDVGHGTLYRYFKNKLDIATSVIDDIIVKISEIVADLPPQEITSLEEYRDRLDQIGGRFFELLDENPEMHDFLFYEALSIDSTVTEKINAAFSLFGAYTELYLRNGIERGFLRDNIRTKEAAFAINAMVFEAARRIASGSPPGEEEKKAWSETITGLILNGLGIQP